MSIKKSESFKELCVLQHHLKNLGELPYFQRIPQDFSQKINQFKLDLEHYENTKTINYEKLTGHISTVEELLFMVRHISKYDKWETPKDTLLTKEELSTLKKEYEISFSEEEIHKYIFFRYAKTLDDISIITLIALPGYFYVGIHNDREYDRDEYFLDDLVTLEELHDKLNACYF